MQKDQHFILLYSRTVFFSSLGVFYAFFFLIILSKKVKRRKKSVNKDAREYKFAVYFSVRAQISAFADFLERQSIYLLCTKKERNHPQLVCLIVEWLEVFRIIKMARWLCGAELPVEVDPHHQDEDSFEFCMILRDRLNLSFIARHFVCEVSLGNTLIYRDVVCLWACHPKFSWQSMERNRQIESNLGLTIPIICSCSEKELEVIS